MKEIIIDDPLLEFFHKLLGNEEEKKILSMLFKDYTDEKILDILINYSTDEVPHA